MIKLKKNAGDILGFEIRLKPKEDIVDMGQRENSCNKWFIIIFKKVI